MADYDVVVIGGGLAGLAAGTVLARARRRVVVVDAGEPRHAPAAHAHGFPALDGISPDELLSRSRAEMTGYGGEFVEDRVERIERDGADFLVRRESGALRARAVLAATGLRDELPDVGGLRERWGRDVLHCPYCHGYEVRDRALAVVGGDNRPFTLHQAQLVRQWSADVVFFPNRIELDASERDRLAARGIEVVAGPVRRVVSGAEGVRGVELADGREVAREAVFVGPRFAPRDELLTELGCAVGDNGRLAVDPSGRTSVDGVWTAGNVSDSPAQLVNAASQGSTAAIAVNHHLLAQDVERA